jgi:hypothetical protein
MPASYSAAEGEVFFSAIHAMRVTLSWVRHSYITQWCRDLVTLVVVLLAFWITECELFKLFLHRRRGRSTYVVVIFSVSDVITVFTQSGVWRSGGLDSWQTGMKGHEEYLSSPLYPEYSFISRSYWWLFLMVGRSCQETRISAVC